METQDRITNKAKDLFFQYGFKGVSMDDIAAGAGISKKTIYQFFTDKHALVDEIIKTELKHTETYCRQQQRQSENAVHETFLSLEHANEILSVSNPMLVYEIEKYYPRTHKKLADHRNKFFTETIKNNLQRGIKEGLYRPDINIDILSKFRISSMFLAFNADIFPHKTYSLIQVMREITENFLYGITTPSGRKLILKYKLKN